MIRIALIAAALLFLAAPSQADAQIYYGYGYPTYGYSTYGSYYGGYYGTPYYGEWGYGYRGYPAYGYRRNYGYPGYVAPSLPSGTGSAFSGSRGNGNYWYWLQQQANQGKIPQSEVNRRMYGNR